MNGIILVGTEFGTLIPIAFLVAAAWCARKSQNKFRAAKARTEAKEQHEKLKKHEEEFDRYVAKVYSKDPLYDYVGSSSVATYPSEPELLNFQAWCVCPNCGDLNVHWLQPIKTIRRKRIEGELDWFTNDLIIRQCRQCGNSWKQKR